jgi:hypothetical protein
MLTAVIPPARMKETRDNQSAIMGLLYDKSILALVLFSVALQLAALPLLFFANRKE